MQEELKELENNAKNSNKKKCLIIVFIVLAIVLLAVGGVLVYKSLDDGSSNKEVVDKKDESSSEDNSSKEDEDSSSENLEDNNESESSSEVLDENEYKVVYFDEYFEGFKLNLTEESRLDLINSTSALGVLDSDYHGAMFSDVISNEYKTVYTLDTALWQLLDGDFELYESNMYKKIILSKSTVEYLAKQLFVDYTMPESVEKTRIGGVFDFVCTSEECSFVYGTFGLTGPFGDGYIFKPEINGNVITVKPIYAILDQYDGHSDNGFIGDFSLYVDHNKKLVKELKNYEVLHSDDVYSIYTQDVYDSWVKEYSSLPTYVYTFTDDYKLVSVEKR